MWLSYLFWLQTRRSRIRFPMMSLENLIAIILPVGMALDSTVPLIEMSTKNVSWGVKVTGA